MYFEQVFGPDTPDNGLALYQVAARAVLVYVVGVAIVRVGKSRLAGRATPLDILLGFILGSLLSRGVTGHASLSGTFIASAAIVASHWLLTYLAYYWHGLGDLVKGHARLLVDNGKMQRAQMRLSHISDHDLLEAMRLHGVEDVRQVKRAYKERNGEISIIRATPVDAA
jgi:uncharacterized membrane protein YcaP (DUF421 family)